MPQDTVAASVAPGDDSPGGQGALSRGWRRFRGWRRSRPFWGGLLLILAGIELLAIPLMGVLAHGAIKIVIYIGIGGVFGVVFGALLIACGLLSWFHPVQRIFYAIVGVLLALGSFVVTNLGGFFLGMLLGVVGASLVFGWAPVRSQDGGRRRHRKAPKEPDDGLDSMLGDPRPRNGGGGTRLLALPVVPLLVLGLAGAGQAPALAAQPAAASGSSCLIPLLSLLCPSSSSPPANSVAATSSPSAAVSPGALTTPTASPTPDPTPSATPTAAPTPTPTGTGSPSPSASASKSANPNANKKAAAPALTAAAVPATLTAGSALMTNLVYDGVATVPTADGPQQMLKFSMSSLSLSGGIVLTVTEGGHSVVTRNPSVDFSGNVVLYATKLSGKLLGLASVTFTPQSPPPPLPLPVITFTDVVTDQPLTMADSLQAPGLDITGS